MGELFGRYGTETVHKAALEIFRQSEQLDRQAVAAIPDGEYYAEGCLDNDGITPQAVSYTHLDVYKRQGRPRGPDVLEI